MQATYYRDIEAAQAALHSAEDMYLARFGWERTCDTPGALWLWRRDFADVDAKRRTVHEHKAHQLAQRGQRASEFRPYGVLLLPKDTALRITLLELDERTEEADEDAS